MLRQLTFATARFDAGNKFLLGEAIIFGDCQLEGLNLLADLPQCELLLGPIPLFLGHDEAAPGCLKRITVFNNLTKN